MKIGDWTARCCLHDLEQLKTQDDVDDAMAFEDEMWGMLGPYSTCRSAVAALAPDHDNEDLAFLVGWYKERSPEISGEISRTLAERVGFEPTSRENP